MTSDGESRIVAPEPVTAGDVVNVDATGKGFYVDWC